MATSWPFECGTTKKQIPIAIRVGTLTWDPLIVCLNCWSLGYAPPFPLGILCRVNAQGYYEGWVLHQVQGTWSDVSLRPMMSGLAFTVHIKEFETDKASSASKLKYGDRKVICWVCKQPLLCETTSYQWFFLILLINLRYFTKIMQKCYCWQTLNFACQTRPL